MKRYLCIALITLATVGTWAGEPNENYVLSLEVTDTSATTVEVTAGLDSSKGEDLYSWYFGVCHDGDLLTLTEEGVVNGEDTEDHSYFFFIPVVHDDPPAYSYCALIAIGEVLEPDDHNDLVRLTYTIEDDSSDATFEFCETPIGDDLVQEINVVTNDEIIVPVTEDLTLSLSSAEFVRGDANDSGDITIMDVIYTARWLYLDGNPPPCETSADSDHNGEVGLLDLLYTLEWIYVDGDEPEAPFPDCDSIPGFPACDKSTSCD